MSDEYKVGVDYDFSRFKAGRPGGGKSELLRHQADVFLKHVERRERMAGVPEFLKMLEEGRTTHLKKNADYSGNNDPYENFHRAAIIMEWFDRPIDKVFAALIGVKLARLANLNNKAYNNGDTPNNESTRDTGMDLMVYEGMWAAYDEHMANRNHGMREKEGPEGPIPPDPNGNFNVQYGPGERYPGPNEFKSPYETADEYEARISKSKSREVPIQTRRSQ